MSEKKTIQINPELFKFSDKNTTRKKQPKTDAPRIKMRSEEKKLKQKSLRKNVLKMIREKQQEEYKRLFDKSTPKKRVDSISSENKEFNTDFNESLEFFSSLAKNQEEKIPTNTTIKKYPNDTVNSMLLLPHSPIEINDNLKMPENFLTQIDMPPAHISQPVNISQPNCLLPPPPKYSSMKNSSLPTYRNWCRQTQRIQPSISNISTYKGPNLIPVPQSLPENNQTQTPMQFMDKYTQQNNTDNSTNISEIVQKYEKTKSLFNDKSKNRIKYLKRKKIFKRTYHVGRSNNKPQIGVLVSNRTIRNRISTEAQLLKQTPIHDVRKFLIKKGFIKIGTSAPNDVLRKMYESVSLVCGEVQNHNPENLLFNFIHDTDH